MVVVFGAALERVGDEGLRMPFLNSAASSSSAVVWKAASIARESLALKGIHFFGLGRGLSGAMACEERGFLLGS